MGTVQETIVIDYARAAAGLRAVATEAANTSKAVEKVGTSAGAAKAGAVNLFAQLQDVGVQLAGGASPFTVAVQQGPQAASAIAQMGAAGVTAAAALSALGVAVAAGYAGWRIYNAETRQAEAIAIALTAAHAELQPLLDSTRRATIDLKEATGELSPLMADLERNSLRALTAWQGATDETRAKLYALRQEQDSLTSQVRDAGRAFYDLIDPTGLAVGVYDDLWGSSADLQGQIDAQIGVINESIVALRTDRETTEAVIVAKNAAKDANDRHTESMRAAKNAADELRKAQDALWQSIAKENEQRQIANALTQANAALSFTRGTMSEAGYQGTLTGLRAGELAGLDPVLVDQREAVIDAMMKLATTISNQEAAVAENTKAVLSASQSQAGQAIGTVTGGANSIVGSLASMGGPIGWIAMIAQLVKSIGDGLLDGVHEWAMSLMDTVGRLPTILTDAVVRSIEEGIPKLFEMIPAFIEGIGDAVPRLVEVLTTELLTSIPRVIELLTERLPEAFENMLRSLFNWETWKQVGETIIKGVLGFITSSDGAKKGHGWWNPFGGLMNLGSMIAGSNDTGAANVRATGLYMLHGGERVLTSGQATSARNRQGNGGVNIHIGSVMGGRAGVRELVDLIRRESGPLGSRVSLGV